jgi:hypothetical protein
MFLGAQTEEDQRYRNGERELPPSIPRKNNAEHQSGGHFTTQKFAKPRKHDLEFRKIIFRIL